VIDNRSLESSSDSDSGEESKDEVSPLERPKAFATGSTSQPRKSISAEAFGHFNPQQLQEFIPIVIPKT
jgi:hypothetical protein